jgi:hypothetical protein
MATIPTPRNAANLAVNSGFGSAYKPGQWICWDFKTLSIEPMHYTIRTHANGRNSNHLKN